MRCSLLSIAALGFASVTLAAPASLQKRDHGRGKVKVVTETEYITVTEIVYVPESSYVPPPPSTTPKVNTPTPEPKPEPTPTPTPTPTPEKLPELAPVPESTPEKKPEPTPEPTYTPEPEPEPVTVTPHEPTPEPTTTPQPQPTPVDDGMSDFERMYVEKHNQLRAKTGAGPLTLDRTMADYAQNHVENCEFKHSDPYKYGENLGAGYATIADSIQAWFDEWTKYPFDQPDFYEGTGHFTQVVWKAATKIGCGKKACNGANGTPGTYYSCNYDQGNLIGSFKENVSRPTS